MEYNKDFETILEEMKNSIDGDISKNEGSLVAFALSPAAAELEELYNDLEVADENTSPLTCDRDHLVQFGANDNIPIKEATSAIWLAQFNEDFEIGERFECEELTFISIQKIDNGKYYLKCETTGVVGNVKPNDELLPIEFISENFEGELVELVEAANDEEDTEVYRTRYLEEKKNEYVMSGNRASYIQLITSQPGVGAVKLYRVTESRKAIEAYILSDDWKKPNEDIVKAVQEVVDPIEQQGDGAGKAPFWHVVNINPVSEMEISIQAKFTFRSGITFEDKAEELASAVEEYFTELNKTWESEDFLTVRLLRVAETLGSIDGVIDVQDILLNGTEENIILDKISIPVRGVIENAD